MNSIESLKLDFDSQIRELNKIDNEKIFDECVYVGSGDSYVAGLIAEYLSNHKCRCYSPSDLSNSKFLQDKTYCFISVTGRTNANIEIARRATESGIKTIAVTLNKNSKLAHVCKEIVPLKITKVNTPTAGFSTFVANVVTCLQLAGIILPKKLNTWYKKGMELSLSSFQSVKLPDETSYILGNNLFYALALYNSFQMAEFFGSTVIAHKLEEFCHSPIFGVKKSHDLWILGQNEVQLSRRLEKLGFRISYFELYNSDILAQLFQSIFFMQNLILLLAKKYGYTELQYVMMKDVLKASSDIIYAQ
jgi:fructoselysine-6-P-deglycase FrlB-like protein